MKVAGIDMTDPWAARVQRNDQVELARATDVPVETVVLMHRVSFEHHGAEKNYRPLLHLTGELQSIRPNEALPFGVNEVTFRSGLGPMMDAFYEFNDAQLAELVSKGYFTEGFEPPSDMEGIPWELPTTIDALVVAPETEGDAPVVFVTIHGQTALALNFENSQYDLAEYFANQLTPEIQEELAQQSAQAQVPTSSGVLPDLFADVQFTEPNAAELNDSAHRLGSLAPQQVTGGYPVVRESIFEDLLAEMNEKNRAEEAQLAAEPAQLDPESIEGIYQDLIAPEAPKPVTDTDEVVPDPETMQPAGHDFSEIALADEEDDFGVAPIALKPAVVQQRRVHLSPEHEKALELELDHADGDSEPGLG